MASNIFTAAITGMNAAQYGITTTEHNISNASTPGFSRQQVLLAPNIAQQFGSGFVGQGDQPPHQNTVGHRWRNTLKSAGLTGVRLHDLRHYYASGLIAAGCDVVTVQRALAH